MTRDLRRTITDINELGLRSALAILHENTSTRSRITRAAMITRRARKAQVQA